MAGGHDGSIKIDTSFDLDSITKSLGKLESAVSGSAKKIEQTFSKTVAHS